jgi:soluble lytic murein transglycosylase-like protein
VVSLRRLSVATRRSAKPHRSRESGQAIVLLVGLAAILVAGTLMVAALGQGLSAKGRHQKAADLASISAAHAMRDAYPRLLEPAYRRPGVPNPRHLDRSGYLELARTAAMRAARANGVSLRPRDVRFSGEDALAPLRVEAIVRGEQDLHLAGQDSSGRAERSVRVSARATAELVPLYTAAAAGGEYQGPFAYRQGKPMRPDVAQAFDRMEGAARREAGISLVITSAFRSDAEQARLFAENPDPRYVARPGTSLHRYGTELDLGPSSAYGWLAHNARRFGFIQRYSWEPWHYGYTHNPGSTSVGYGRPSSRDGSVSAVPSFVPARYRGPIVDASRRWSVSAALIAAQIQAESGFNPRAVSPAGAQGIAQFMPATARAYGLRDPFDPDAAIDAQAHLMHDLLRRFGSVPLALAAYNAGAGAVAACGCVPPYPETQAYVARILGLIGGQGLTGIAFEVRLVE